MPPFRCSDGARARGDALIGTAFPARRLLLVEVPGPWGHRAITASRLDRGAGAALLARTDPAGVRLQVIRRAGKHAAVPEGTPHRVALVDLGAGSRGLVHWSSWTTAQDLLDLPLTTDLHAPLDPERAAASGPQRLALVCTHTRHDVCCALRGRPVAAALAAKAEGWQVWESSHLGGDRFAGNLLLLPHGDVFGRLDADSALDAVQRYDDGRLALEYWRGRCGRGNAAQAALYHAARELADDRTDAFSVNRIQQRDDVVRVTLDRTENALIRSYVVTLSARWTVPERLTCAALEAKPARVFDLLDVSVVPAVSPAQ